MAIWLEGILNRFATAGSRRDRIPDDIKERLPLADVETVTFYQRDEITTDLICCEIRARDLVWVFHEEAEGWDRLVAHLEELPGFRRDWYQAVVQPPFATTEAIAYTRE
jgi:hypothetical protein